MKPRTVMVASVMFALVNFRATPAEVPPHLEARALAGEVVRSVKETGVFPNPKVLRGRTDVLPVLMKEMQSLEPKTRRNLVANAFEVGADPTDKQERWFHSRDLVSFLLQIIQKDEDADVRDLAAKFLVHNVPDMYMRAHAVEVVNIARTHLTDWDVYLLGKTGAVEARDLLKMDKRFAEENTRSYELALAKLGDSALADKFIDKYRGEKDPSEKARYVWELGYIGTPECVLALARDIRTPIIVKLPSRGERSLRVDIIKALGMVYPEEPRFWISRVEPPSNDVWYKNIEDWLAKRFDVEWKEKRPEFLFEIQGPGGQRR